MSVGPTRAKTDSGLGTPGLAGRGTSSWMGPGADKMRKLAGEPQFAGMGATACVACCVSPLHPWTPRLVAAPDHVFSTQPEVAASPPSGPLCSSAGFVGPKIWIHRRKGSLSGPLCARQVWRGVVRPLGRLARLKIPSTDNARAVSAPSAILEAVLTLPNPSCARRSTPTSLAPSPTSAPRTRTPSRCVPALGAPPARARSGGGGGRHRRQAAAVVAVLSRS